MNIAIIGTAGLPASYGGFETLAENLVEYLGEKYQFTVYCSSSNRVSRPNKYKNADLVYIPLQANGVQSTPYDILSIFKALSGADVLLILGVSGCICLPLVKVFSKKKVIAHIDGLEWQREKWGNFAKKFLKLSEKYAVKYADIIISDNLAIKEYVKTEYQKDSVLIEYGGDHVVPEKEDDYDKKEEWPLAFPRKSYAVKVCRIEPENNVHLVLDAFSKSKSMPLLMIGNWSYSSYGRNLQKKYKNVNNIELLDPIYDKDQLYLLRSNAAIYVHGHSAGGTNPSLVEAMYLGLPIISYDVQYNRETTRNSALYFSSLDELLNILNELEKDSLSRLGSAMKDIALKFYKWKIIADKFSQLFDPPVSG